SRWSTSSTRARSLDAGVTTLSLRACWPLRMRVSKSPTGSVNAIFGSLPARLRDARNQALVGQFTEHDARETELAVVSTRTTGQLATIANPGWVRVARDLCKSETRNQAL